MRNGFSRSVEVAFAGLALLASIAAAPRRQSRFMIGGWAPVGFADTSAFRKLNDAGLDFCIPVRPPGYSSLSDQITAARTVARLASANRSFTLQVMSSVQFDDRTRRRDPRSLKSNASPTANLAAMWAALDSLNLPSVMGFDVWDEPCTAADLDSAARSIQVIARHQGTADRVLLVNLLQAYAGDTSGCYRATYGREKEIAYPRYVGRYLAAFPADAAPPVLCTDQYPFENPRAPRTDYFFTLRCLQDAARDYRRSGADIPIWQWIQISANTREPSAPSIAEIRWQAYAALAYGVKGLLYWTLAPTSFRVPPNYGGGILDARSDTTGSYRMIRVLNHELHELGGTLVRLRPLGVHHKSAGNQLLHQDETFGASAGVDDVVVNVGPGDSDCMVGDFMDPEGASAFFLVVNKSLTTPRTFTLRFRAPADSLFRVSKTDGSRRFVGKGLSSYLVPLLEPGSGELFEVTR